MDGDALDDGVGEAGGDDLDGLATVTGTFRK
jgi:hypothetical protein